MEDEEAYFESVSKSKPEQVTWHGTAELGISIHDPEAWGGGYSSEAVRLMVEYGMFFLGLHNIVLNVFSYNTRGIRAYEKVGFREIGRRRGAIRLGHERFDAVQMDITADKANTSRMRALVRLLGPPSE